MLLHDYDISFHVKLMNVISHPVGISVFCDKINQLPDTYKPVRQHFFITKNSFDHGSPFYTVAF